VALDVDGNVHSIAKWTGLKAKDVRAKLGSPENLPSVDETQSNIRSKVSDQMRGYIREVKDRQNSDLDPLREKLRDMNNAHHEERKKLKAGQDKRWADEKASRQERFNKGLQGVFDRLSGKAKSIRQQNELEARKSARRDQKQRDFMVVEQMKERRVLQREFKKLRRSHADERRMLAGNIRLSLRSSNDGKSKSPNRSRRRGFDISL